MATLLHPTQAHLTVLPHVSSVCNLFLLFLHFCIPAGSLSSFVLLSCWLHIALPVHSVCLNYPPDAVLWHMLQMGQEGIPQCMCCEQGQDRVIEDTELWKYSLEQSKAYYWCTAADGAGKSGQPLFPLGRPQTAAQPGPGSSTFSSFSSSAGNRNGNPGTTILHPHASTSRACLFLAQFPSVSWGACTAGLAEGWHSRSHHST